MLLWSSLLLFFGLFFSFLYTFFVSYISITFGTTSAGSNVLYFTACRDICRHCMLIYIHISYTYICNIVCLWMYEIFCSNFFRSRGIVLNFIRYFFRLPVKFSIILFSFLWTSFFYVCSCFWFLHSHFHAFFVVRLWFVSYAINFPWFRVKRMFSIFVVFVAVVTLTPFVLVHPLFSLNFQWFFLRCFLAFVYFCCI